MELSLPFELSLLRCGSACKEFQEELLKCSFRSGADRTNFRHWAKLRYMGDDIDGFRQLLAGYRTRGVDKARLCSLQISSFSIHSSVVSQVHSTSNLL